MTDSEVIAIINQDMIREFELDPADMLPESRLVEDLEMDSLDFVDLVIVMQNAFDVKLRDDPTVRDIRTLSDLHNLILQKKNQIEAEGSSKND